MKPSGSEGAKHCLRSLWRPGTHAFILFFSFIKWAVWDQANSFLHPHKWMQESPMPPAKTFYSDSWASKLSAYTHGNWLAASHWLNLLREADLTIPFCLTGKLASPYWTGLILSCLQPALPYSLLQQVSSCAVNGPPRLLCKLWLASSLHHTGSMFLYGMWWCQSLGCRRTL